MNMLIMSTVAGALIGAFAHKATGLMITKRSDDQQKSLLISAPGMVLCWIIFFALLFANLSLLNPGNNIKAVEYMVYFSAFICIAVVDSATRKIPNELLYLLMISKFAFEILLSGKWDIALSFFGLGVASLLFLMPSILHIKIGMGDIKYAAILGFLLGVGGFLQAILVMSMTMTIYAIVLYIKKTGNLKTSVPVGPFLSLGAIIYGIVPIIKIY